MKNQCKYCEIFFLKLTLIFFVAPMEKLKMNPYDLLMKYHLNSFLMVLNVNFEFLAKFERSIEQPEQKVKLIPSQLNQVVRKTILFVWLKLVIEIP